MDREAGKIKAAQKAVQLVKSGMTLGLGTGSTAAHFIALLGEKIAQGWALKGVPTSEATRALAIVNGVEIIDPDETTTIDLAVDGADEVDQHDNLIKGGGGALLREKIVAYAADQFVVIADRSKRVATLGAFALPVEVDPFAWGLSVRALRNYFDRTGFDHATLTLRHNPNGVFLTDGGNYIIDCALTAISDPSRVDVSLNALPGVVETGLFAGIADEVILE